MLRDLGCDPVRLTAGYSFLCISVNEVCTLFLHDICLFLTHGTTNQVTSSHRITAQITHDLHNLLLIYDTAIGRCQDRF